MFMEIYLRIMGKIIVFIVYIILFSIKVNAEEFKVFYSGFSFTGNYSDKTATIKLTDQILKKKVDGMSVIDKSLLDATKKITPKNFTIITASMADLEKGEEESIVMSVALDYEEYNFEFEPITKTYLNYFDLYFQILFYNFKSKKLIASIPYSAEISFFSKNKLEQKEILDHLKRFYSTGLTGKTKEPLNAFTVYEKIMNNFELKNKYRNRMGVTKVIIEDKAKDFIPDTYKSRNESLKILFAQSFSTRLSLNQNVALVPYNEGESLGKTMKLVFVNTDTIFNILLPKPDFNIELTIRGFKKVKAKESDISALYLYGSYINLKILQPELNKIYLDDKFKKSHQVKIPKNIKNIKDWRKFYFSTVKLFEEVTEQFSLKNPEWIKASNGNMDIISKFAEIEILLSKCR